MEVQYPLVFFTLFLCLSAGMMAIQGWLLFKGRGTKRFHVALVVAEVVALAIGGFASFLHLHHWERIFNGFGHLTSGITQELIGIVVAVVVAVIVFVMLRKAGDPAVGEGSVAEADGGRLVPSWVGILAFVVGIAMGFVCAHSYDMSARPAWSNVMLYVFYYSSEFVLGAAGVWLTAAVCKQDGLTSPLAKLAFVAGIVSALAMVASAVYWTTIDFNTVGIAFHTTDPTAAAVDPAAVMSSALSGSNALLFWGGAVVVGSLVCVAAGLACARKPDLSLPASATALVCSLAGGVCFRVVLYAVGLVYYVYF